ncbi:hypothetical protein HDF26_003943 [Pedobacter cryoconitis]|uniref:hypothetical protein n=1 Tax=Pedobacter cryoconitis TaxID=188932 RepID=UPI00160874C3|nr:hypothetical protein [Pedobacter cryoconitis]MBB6273483.1 hypothetical protein [Pedobacter cryoconitis]
MYSCLLKLPPVLFGVACLMSCSLANNKPLSIQFSPDSTSIVFSDIDPAGLWQLKNRPGIDTAHADVVSVSEVSPDDDIADMEHDVAGKLEITDSNLVFKPQKSFISGKKYLVISYMNVKFATNKKIISGQLNHSVMPQQVVLKR